MGSVTVHRAQIGIKANRKIEQRLSQSFQTISRLTTVELRSKGTHTHRKLLGNIFNSLIRDTAFNYFICGFCRNLPSIPSQISSILIRLLLIISKFRSCTYEGFSLFDDAARSFLLYHCFKYSNGI